MENTTTLMGLGCCAGAVLLAGLMVTGIEGSDPSPGEIRQKLPHEAFLDQGPLAASVAQVGLRGTGNPRGPAAMAFAAAPAGEFAPRLDRHEQLARIQVGIAVGQNARGMLDPAFETGFANFANDLEVTFATCADRDAIDLMMVDRSDMALLGGSLSTREQHAGLRQTRVGVELFALAVASDFPTDSLSHSQMRQLLTGEIVDWQRLGYDRGAVVVVVPSQRTLAERAARTLMLGDNFTAKAIGVASARYVTDQILRNPGAIGVVRVTNTPPVGMKLLQIDWTPPTADAFGYGTYPYGVPLHVVTSGQPNDLAVRFLEFARSEDGSELLSRTMHVQ